MIPFLVYLFESGMCLTLLFLVYYLFLRKETYFTFNRIYLISILIFSLLFPIIHLNFTSPKTKVLEGQVQEIDKFKSYYENIIALTDPDYLQSFSKPFRENETNEFDEISGAAFSSHNSEKITSISEKNSINKKTGFWDRINLSTILLILYLLGILFFAGRLFLLFRWINQTLKKYGSTVENGVEMVKMDEEVPPFSFFRIIFLNRETISLSGFGQIVAHEKVHIGQLHSIDLLLAHAITVFQWFNPFVWFINKAMKTNHEYIADRNVVEQGYELFDYQSLLLKQIISIRSVELVNNFNLINIKKRIAMMTKIKSGIAAQLKALVVIPSAIFLFFFFAEISFAQDAIGFQNKDLTKEIEGFWKNEDNDTYGILLNFKGNNLQILEDNENYRELSIQFPKGSVGVSTEHYYKTDISKYVKNIEELSVFHTLPLQPGKSKLIQLLLKKDKLIVAWTPEKVSIYKRVTANSSLEYFSNEMGEDFEPVSAKYYRITENPNKTYYLFMNKNHEIYLNNEMVSLEKFQEKINEIKKEGNPFAAEEKIPTIVIDERCEMAFVNVMFRKLADFEIRYILSVKPFDEKVPEVFYHNVGIPRSFPIKPGLIKMITFDEIEKETDRNDLKLIRIDLSKQDLVPEQIVSQLNEGIQKGLKYVILFSYTHETNYKQYITVLDRVYTIVHSKRNTLAQEKYQLDFDDLATAQQKEIRKVFPLALTEKNVDYQPE